MPTVDELLGFRDGLLYRFASDIVLEVLTPANAPGFLQNDGSGNYAWVPASGTGTVTSVGLSLPAIFTITGSPVTVTGTLTATLAVQSANRVFAGPATGADAGPAFRALVVADMPAGLLNSLLPNQTGNAGRVLGTDGATLSWVVQTGGGGGGSGTVTSVDLTVPPWLAVAGNPITGSGVLTVTAATGQTNHRVLGTGTTGQVGLIALTAADIPTTAVADNVLTVSVTNGSDATGARGVLDRPFKTLAAARTAAQSGDVIWVYPGVYTCAASLAKDGVDWHFFAGATVTFNADTTEGVWDDGGAAMTFVVTGAGTFARTGAASSTVSTTVNCSHASSNISVNCLDLSAAGSSSRVVSCSAGILQVNCRDVTAGSGSFQGTGVWWGNGRLSVTGRRCAAGNGVYSSVTATPTGDGHVRFDEIVARTYGVYDQSTDATAAFWVRANIIKHTLANQAAVTHGGASRLYVEAQKLFGTVLLNGSGLMYLRTDKVSSVSGGLLYQTGGWTGTAFIQVSHWDGTGIGSNIYAFQASGGTHDFLGGSYVAPATAGGFQVGGTAVVRLRSTKLDTSANNAVSPLRVIGGTTYLDGACTLVAEGSRDSITATSAQTVFVDTVLNANRPVNVNVTLSYAGVISPALDARYQPLDADLTAIAALTTTSFGLGGLVQADGPAFRAYIGAGTSSFSGAFSALSGLPTTLAGYGITDAAPINSPSFTGQVKMNVKYGDWTDDVDGATVTFNLDATDKHRITLGGNRTFALSGGHDGQGFVVRIKQSTGGGQTVTWWANITWFTADGNPPVLASGANKYTYVSFYRHSATQYDGFGPSAQA